ncbi:hypothetical protein AJ80_05176 [Polytolypa hystricis UAMH7299]|uniref:Uncharacterized protein n=1 Tax=Polytolypa hystricis (strain UAMH7299) TaxID=1447883 RepID=A0A2B7Y662_POLH7|nr:hypothetical protein AJ80_05176 [Polytolypa hystricis UAMH7299]
MAATSPTSIPQYHRNNMFYENHYSRSNMYYSYSFSNSTFSSPASLPPPPPPSPSDSLLDITPRKSSFSMTAGRSSACAFPSWPNRSSLYSDSESSASAYLSDEDLFFSDSPAPEAVIDEEEELTTEQQISRYNQAAEEQEQRVQYLANLHAHARAQQALRSAQLAAEQAGGKQRRKRRVHIEKKKRSSSSSSSSTNKSTASG